MATEVKLTPLPWHDDVERVVNLHRLTLLVGDRGVGKTTFAKELCHRRTSLRPEIVPGTPATEEHHIWGFQTMKSGNSGYHDGPLPRALKQGRDLIIEELNLIPHEIRATLLGLRGSSYVRNPNSGEDIEIPDAFRLIATSNPETMRCRRNIEGTLALLDDFMIIVVPNKNRQLMKEVLSAETVGVSSSLIETILDQWEEYQDLSDEDAVHLSYRAAQHLQKLLAGGFEMTKAVQIALVNPYIVDEDAIDAGNRMLDMS